MFVPRANYGLTAELIEALRQSRDRLGESGIGPGGGDAGRRPDPRPRARVAATRCPSCSTRGTARSSPSRSLREDRVIGGLVVRRKAAGAFSADGRGPAPDLRDPVGHRHPECAALPGDRREEPGARRALAQPGAALPPLDGAPGAAVAHASSSRASSTPRARWSASTASTSGRSAPTADGLMVTAQAGFEERDWHDLAGRDHPHRRGGSAGRRLPRRRAAALHRREPAAGRSTACAPPTRRSPACASRASSSSP